jgi:hypothetical protein
MDEKKGRRVVGFGQSQSAADRVGAFDRNFDHLQGLRLGAGEDRIEKHRGKRQGNEPFQECAALGVRHDNRRHIAMGAASVKIAHEMTSRVAAPALSLHIELKLSVTDV